MKLNFKDILNAVNQIEQSRSYFGENYDSLRLREKYEDQTPLAASGDVEINSIHVRTYSVEREYDGTFTVDIPESHLKVNK
jgi:hypothetical protein